MRLDLHLPLTRGQIQRHAAEIKAITDATSGSFLRGNMLKVGVNLEQLTAQGVDDVLITIRAARLLAGVDDEQETLIEETLRGLKKALS